MTKKQKALIIVLVILGVVIHTCTTIIKTNADYVWWNSIQQSATSVLFLFPIMGILAVIRSKPGRDNNSKKVFTIIICVLGGLAALETFDAIVRIIKS